MKTLMDNNVMKLILCAGIFCNMSFAMDKDHTIINISQTNLYVEHDNGNYSTYRVIGQDGIESNIDGVMFSRIRLLNKFEAGDLTKSKDGKYCVQGKYDYAAHVAMKKDPHINTTYQPLNLHTSDFIVPIECTEAQLKEVVRLCSSTYMKAKVFVIDQYNARLDIGSISLDVNTIIEQLRLDDERKGKEDRMRFEEECQKSRDGRFIQDMIKIACCSCLLGCGIFLSNF
jgi:hypothetical protein